MAILDFKKVDVGFKRDKVDVPEFGEGVFVYARNLTAQERRLVAQAARIQAEANGDTVVYHDTAQLVAFGAVKNNGDGLGKPVFPSADFVRNLPSDYVPAVNRIARRVMELSGMRTPASEQVDAAKKN